MSSLYELPVSTSHREHSGSVDHRYVQCEPSSSYSPLIHNRQRHDEQYERRDRMVVVRAYHSTCSRIRTSSSMSTSHSFGKGSSPIPDLVGDHLARQPSLDYLRSKCGFGCKHDANASALRGGELLPRFNVQNVKTGARHYTRSGKAMYVTRSCRKDQSAS